MRFLSVFLPVAVLSGLISGCTVLEDRRECPCYLDLDYGEILDSRPLEDRLGRVDVTLYAPSPIHSVSRKLSECPTVEEVSVEKTEVRAIGVVHDRPLRDFLSEGTRIVYEPGNQIDSLFVHTEAVDCSGEEAYCLLKPHKQFSTIWFTDSEGGDICRNFNMVVRGTTCGFDALDLSAVEGEYLYTVQERDTEDRIWVRIPRQLRGDLSLEFWDKDDHLMRFACPVGLYLFDLGYDAGAADLEDYSIRIDFREGLLYLRVADWELERVYALYE